MKPWTKWSTGMMLVIAGLGLVGCPPQIPEGQGEEEETSEGGAFDPPLTVSDWVKGTPVWEREAGKIYLVEFWATWCVPCKISIPHLTELQERYGEAGLVVIGVTHETAEVALPFVEALGDTMDYTVACDPSSETFRAYNVSSIPVAFLFDQSGEIVWSGFTVVEGGVPDESLEEAIKALL